DLRSYDTNRINSHCQQGVSFCQSRILVIPSTSQKSKTSIAACHRFLDPVFQPLQPTSLTFPNSHYLPPKSPQPAGVTLIPLDITSKLAKPEVLASLGCVSKLTALVPVPEAPMHKNYPLPFRQNNIRSTRQARYVNAESVTHTMQERSHNP